MKIIHLVHGILKTNKENNHHFFWQCCFITLNLIKLQEHTVILTIFMSNSHLTFKGI